MKYITPSEINGLFSILNQSGVRYALLKNSNDYLPDKYTGNDDIDVIVHPCDKKLFHRVMKKFGFVRNPFLEKSKKNGYIVPDSISASEYYKKDSIVLDVNYKLSILDHSGKLIVTFSKRTQDYLWQRKNWNIDKNWFQLDDGTVILYCIAKSIINKNHFSEKYIEEIENRINWIDEELKQQLSYLLGDLTDDLLHMLENKEYEQIIKKWKEFTASIKDTDYGFAKGKICKYAKMDTDDLLFTDSFWYNLNDKVQFLIDAKVRLIPVDHLLIRGKKKGIFPYYHKAYSKGKKVEDKEETDNKDVKDLKDATNHSVSIAIHNEMPVIVAGMVTPSNCFLIDSQYFVRVLCLAFEGARYSMPKHPLIYSLFSWNHKKVRTYCGKIRDRLIDLYYFVSKKVFYTFYRKSK